MLKFATFDVQHHESKTSLAFKRSRSKFKVKTAMLKIFSHHNISVVVWDIYTNSDILKDIGHPEVTLDEMWLPTKFESYA